MHAASAGTPPGLAVPPEPSPPHAPQMARVAAGVFSTACAPDSAPSPLRKAERDAWLGVRVLPCIVCRRRCAASVCLSLQCPEGWLADALPPCASVWVTSGRVSGRCGGPVLINYIDTSDPPFFLLLDRHAEFHGRRPF